MTLVRYIEANPLVAGLVERAEDWPWSSLTERINGQRRIVDDGPVALPPNWADIVNERWPQLEVTAGLAFRCNGGDSATGTEVKPLRTQAGIRLSTVGVEAPARQGARSAHTGSM